MVERLALDQKVDGSNPSRAAIGEWSSQVRHLFWVQGIRGSNPFSPTMQVDLDEITEVDKDLIQEMAAESRGDEPKPLRQLAREEYISPVQKKFILRLAQRIEEQNSEPE